MTRFFASLLALAVIAAPAAAQNNKAAANTATASAPTGAPAASSPNETVVEEIVARINNSIITRADLRREEDRAIQEVRQQNAPDPNAAIADRQKNLLRSLIDQQLLIQKGSDLGITADADVIKRLDEMRKEMGAASMEDLEKMAEQQGISFEDYKQNMKNSIITQQVIGREVGSRIQITHEDVAKFYNDHKAELDQPERIRLSEILVSATVAPPAAKDGTQQPAPEPTPEELASAEAKANEALAKIKAGTKFEEVAKQFSNGPTMDQGGDLGYFKRGTLSKELEDQTFKMKAGETTGVIRTKQGFVILKVTDHSEAGIPPLKKVEDQIRETLYYQRVDPAVREYLTKLRDDAYIDIKPGFVDTGASANQTKLVYTNVDEKKAKNLKTKKKKKHFILF